MKITLRKRGKSSTKRYAVAAAYANECCDKPHTWLRIINATSCVAAEAKMRRGLEREGADISEIFVLHLATRKPKNTRVPFVRIEVTGGVADVTRKTRGVRVSLIDHDDAKAVGAEPADVEQVWEAHITEARS